MVMDHHSRFHPELERTGNQLKKKFNKFTRTKVPTGEPNIPFIVSEAKAIWELIIEKEEGATGLEEEGFAAEDGEDVEENDNEDVDGAVDAGAGNDASIAETSRGGMVSRVLSSAMFKVLKTLTHVFLECHSNHKSKGPMS